MLDGLSQLIAACRVSPQGARDAHVSLELAALLGPEIYTDEWRMACEICGVEASDELVDALVDAGSAARRGEMWRFENTTLVDELIDYVREANSWTNHHNICANALYVAAPPHRSGVARRRVVHLLEAGSLEEALEPLLQAEKAAYGNGAYDDSRQYLDTRERLLDDLGAEADDPRRAQNDWRRAQLLQVHGQRTEALELTARSCRLLRSTDWASERGHAALLYGQMLRDEGRFDEAWESFEKAARDYGAGGDNSGLASSRANMGFLKLEYGFPARAREYFADALRVFEQIEDTFMVSSMWSQMSYAWLMEGNREEASRCAELGRKIAHNAGHKPTEASAWTALGEIARAGSDWTEARACIEKAIELWQGASDRNLHIVRYNLALVEIGDGHYGVAKALLEEVKDRFSELGFGPRAPLVNAGLMVCCAAEGDWEGFERFQALASRSVGELGLGDSDLVWLAEKAAELADKQGREDAKAMALELVG